VEDIGAEKLHRYFADKVFNVRTSTDGVPPPKIASLMARTSFFEFRPLSIDDFAGDLRSLPDKSCASDLLPTRLLKENVDILAPLHTDIFSCSLSTGVILTIVNDVYIMPLLKKSDMDSGEAKSYRPISNLSVVSKFLERLTAQKQIDHLTSSGLLPAAVGVSTSPLDGNCHFEGCVRHPVSDRCRRSVCTRAPGLVGRFRYGRPLDTSSPS
jgi:hypothetical protein